ncbi:MAG: recombinase family protein [Rhabdochlamydiaceae bacterium]
MHVTGQKAKRRLLVTYCRVSSAGQKKDLISQKNAVESFCQAAGKKIIKMARDNENR